MDEINEIKKSDRSEEVAEIIERMPVVFGLWAGGVVFFLVAVTFTFGWLVKYPDTVTGDIEINAKYSSVKLIANASGKLILNGFKAQDKVKEGAYIAIIQNPADYVDVQKILCLLQTFDINASSFLEKRDMFPKKVSLGELNIKYFTFLNDLKKICIYEENNIHEKKEESLMLFIEKQKEILNQDLLHKNIKEKTLTILSKALSRDSIMRNDFSKMAVSEDEFEKTQINCLTAKENYISLCNDITTTQLQIFDAKNKIEQNRIDKMNDENQMYLDLLSAFNDLKDNVKQWEQKYVFKAPFDGKVEYLKFWSNNQYIQTGEEAFTIVPSENQILGQVHLPADGAGKIKNGCDVIIKLNNYPYMEYGSVKGKVKSISLTTNINKRADQSEIETYLVLVELPEELSTNYGSKLEFKYELKGTADIIANNRRLVERLFDNLRYRLSN